MTNKIINDCTPSTHSSISYSRTHPSHYSNLTIQLPQYLNPIPAYLSQTPQYLSPIPAYLIQTSPYLSPTIPSPPPPSHSSSTIEYRDPVSGKITQYTDPCSGKVATHPSLQKAPSTIQYTNPSLQMHSASFPHDILSLRISNVEKAARKKVDDKQVQYILRVA